jgi:hypothetical protein
MMHTNALLAPAHAFGPVTLEHWKRRPGTDEPRKPTGARLARAVSPHQVTAGTERRRGAGREAFGGGAEHIWDGSASPHAWGDGRGAGCARRARTSASLYLIKEESCNIDR